MHDQFRNKSKQKVLKNSPGEAEVCPIVPVLQILQTIAIFERHIAPKVLLVEYLNGNLSLAPIFCSISLRAKVEIVFHWPTWEPCFFIHAWGHGRKGGPECHEYWDSGAYRHEYCEVEAATQLK